MRKGIARFITAIIAVGLLLGSTATTAFASATPRLAAIQAGATGGGCITYLPYDIPADVAIKSCISENSSRNIASDSYLTYYGGPYSLVSCNVTVSMRDDSWGTTVARQTYNFCSSYYGPLYHGAVSGHVYHTYVWITLKLSNGQSYLTGDSFASPDQTAG